MLNSLRHHESNLAVEKHHIDTLGATNHVLGLMHLLGFRFAPRIQDLDITRPLIPRGIPVMTRSCR